MKLNRISLTPKEAGWFSRNVPKALEVLDLKAKRDAATKERVTYKVLTKMQKEAARVADIVNAFTEQEQYEVDVFLNRKQKLVLSGLVDKMKQSLNQGAIPKYEKDPKQYEEYLKNAIEKAQMLNNLLRKLK